MESLSQVLVPTANGAQVPISQIADIRKVNGPSMIRDENGMLAGYVFVDLDTSDLGGYVEKAKEVVREKLTLPAGYSLVWSGQYENMLRVRERLKIVVPVTLVLIFALLYMNTKSTFKATLVMLAVPFSLIGAVWLLYILGYNISIAVWVGMIALMGLDAETGVFMLLFLDLSYDEARRKGQLKTKADLEEAIIHGAVKRVRPEDDDRRRRLHGPDADHVVHRHRRGHDETRGRADGRRAGHVVPARIARLPGDLLPVEMAEGSEAPDVFNIRGPDQGALRIEELSMKQNRDNRSPVWSLRSASSAWSWPRRPGCRSSMIICSGSCKGS